MTFICNDHPIVPDKRLDSIFRHGRVQYFPGHQRGQGREDRPAFHGPCEDFHATCPEPDLREDHGALREAFPRHLPALSEGRHPALRGRQQLPHPRPAAAPSPCSISITSAPPGNAPVGVCGFDSHLPHKRRSSRSSLFCCRVAGKGGCRYVRSRGVHLHPLPMVISCTLLPGNGRQQEVSKKSVHVIRLMVRFSCTLEQRTSLLALAVSAWACTAGSKIFFVF